MRRLDEATEIDTGDPADLARHFRFLTRRLRHLNVLGGCCGIDQRHIGEIAAACALPLERAV